MIATVVIDVVVLFTKSKSQLEVVLISPIAGGDQSAELWRGRNTNAYVVYHQDAYYNPKLLAQRKQGRMHHPLNRGDLMDHVGQLWGASTWSSDDSWELSRTRIILDDVCVDEI